MSWSDAQATLNPCTEMIVGQPLNPSGRPLSFTDAIPYRDLLKMAEYDEQAAELDGFRDRLARLAAEECRRTSATATGGSSDAVPYPPCFSTRR